MPPEIMRGIKQTLPIVLGYIPVGFAYGVLARKNGLAVDNTLLMSVLVFAGSAQLIGVGLIGAGASAASVIVTTFIVNLRHLLMSAALAPHLSRWPKWLIALFGFQLTDETFGLHSLRFPKGETEVTETLAVNMTAQGAWVLGTALGVFSSSLITDVEPIGLDFALPAMFIALLAAQLKNKNHLAVALAAGLFSTLLALYGLDGWNVMAATVAAATIGVLLPSWTRAQSS